MITVIIPAYNAEKTIMKCLNSVFSQKGEYEVIVVNDGSEDLTESYVMDFVKKYLNCHYYWQKHQGQGNARNFGVSKAKGKWLLFLDADDILLEGAIQKLMSVRDSTADIVCFEYLLKTDISESVTRTKLCFNVLDKKDILIKTTSVLWDKMFRKSFWDAQNIVLDNHYGEDLVVVLWLLVKAGKIEILGRLICKHFDETDNMSHQWNRLLEITDSLERMLEKFKTDQIFNEYKLELLYFCYYQFRLYPDSFKKRFPKEIHNLLCINFDHLLKKYFNDEITHIKALGDFAVISIGSIWGKTDILYTFSDLLIKYIDLETYLLHPIQHKKILFSIDVGNECKEFICGTRNEEWVISKWERQCREFRTLLDGQACLVFLSRMNQGHEIYYKFEEIFQQIFPEANILSEQNILGQIFERRLGFHNILSEISLQAELGGQNYRGECYRQQYNVNILNRWLRARQEGKSLEAYFQKNKITSIAIYGMGFLGERLADELKPTAVEVLYAVDKGGPFEYNGLPVYSSNSGLPQPEMMVVSIVHLFKTINYELGQILECPVVSLETIINEVC